MAEGAVRRAAETCEVVRAEMVGADTLVKKDRSPVTVADFASQAVVSAWLLEAGDETPLVAEESADFLRTVDAQDVREAVVRRTGWALGAVFHQDEVLRWIDRGDCDPPENGRFWTLDPIDGTKGFLRGEQYAVALALLEEGRPVVGALACPRLDPQGLDGEGSLLVAVRGEGAELLSLRGGDGSRRTLRVETVREFPEVRLTESVESGHSKHDDAARIAQVLGIVEPSLRIDSQAKYAVLARGEASVYLRMPTRADYREKIWDHAAGALIVEEAGGRVTDVTGAPLDFSQGRALENNRGVVATCGAHHDRVISAIGGL